MMGRLRSGQGQLFYQFDLNDAVPDDHLGPVDKRDSQITFSMIQDCLSRGGRIGARRSEQCRMGNNFTAVAA